MADTEAGVDFDVIVVGAGIAGALTAYLLAQRGRTVALIERGESPGSKNLSGGVLYTHALREAFPDLVDQAPVERRITRNVIQFLNQDSAVSIDYQDAKLTEPPNAVTVLRAPFDRWLAERAEEAGAVLLTGIRVDTLLTEPSGQPAGVRVVGVKAGDDELRCRVVVAADGVNSFLARAAGLRSDPSPNQLALGIKALVLLPRSTIEDRFGVGGDEGAAWAVVGDCTKGLGGGGFVYTNRESVSVGIVVRLDALVESGIAATDLFDGFLSHPFLERQLAGGEVGEYGAHLVAEGGLGMVGDLAADGLVLVGDAAGLTLNTGLTVRGMDLAAASATAAAKGIEQALAAGDVSATGLAGYRDDLFAGFAGQDLRTYAKAPAFLERPRMYRDYGQLLAGVMQDVFRHDLRPRRHLARVVRERLRQSPVRPRDVVSDGIAGVRAL